MALPFLSGFFMISLYLQTDSISWALGLRFHTLLPGALLPNTPRCPLLPWAFAHALPEHSSPATALYAHILVAFYPPHRQFPGVGFLASQSRQSPSGLPGRSSPLTIPVISTRLAPLLQS